MRPEDATNHTNTFTGRASPLAPAVTGGWHMARSAGAPPAAQPFPVRPPGCLSLQLAHAPAAGPGASALAGGLSLPTSEG